MARAEYESQKALAAVIPDNVVIPLAWGVFEKDKSKAFFMTRFRDLRDSSPPTLQFLAILKKLHQTSVSPTGKFGFHVTTYNGPPKMVNEWTDSWEEYYARQCRSDISCLQQVYGEDAELADLTEEFVQKVVARLLRPLQTGGRSIKPTLCHGDLWDGNVQIDVDTKQPIMFDSCAFYGHNESQHAVVARTLANAHLADGNMRQWTSNAWATPDTSSEWVSSTSIKMKSELLSPRRTFTTVMICMPCKSARVKKDLEFNTNPFKSH